MVTARQAVRTELLWHVGFLVAKVHVLSHGFIKISIPNCFIIFNLVC